MARNKAPQPQTQQARQASTDRLADRLLAHVNCSGIVDEQRIGATVVTVCGSCSGLL